MMYIFHRKLNFQSYSELFLSYSHSYSLKRSCQINPEFFQLNQKVLMDHYYTLPSLIGVPLSKVRMRDSRLFRVKSNNDCENHRPIQNAFHNLKTRHLHTNFMQTCSFKWEEKLQNSHSN